MSSAIHTCGCDSYNGGPCYNCLNGAHELCEKCMLPNGDVIGFPIEIKTALTVPEEEGILLCLISSNQAA